MRVVCAITRAMIKELFRRKDFYVLLMLLVSFLVVLSTQNFFQVKGISRYIKDLGYSLMMFFSFVIAVVFSAKQIPSEIQNKTIYPLLAKPLSRYMFIFAKFMGSFFVSTSAYSLFFLAFLFCGIVKNIEINIITMVEAYFCGILFLCLTTAIVIFLSTFLTMAANVTISFVLYFLITGFSDLLYNTTVYAKGFKEVILTLLYYFVPHLDFYDFRVRIAHDWDPLKLVDILAIILYTLIYSSFILYFAGNIFKRKKL